MFRKPSQDRELAPPPIAASNPEAAEILRAWAAPGAPQQFVLRTCWKEPGAWGLLLADLARHVSLAYQREGRDPEEVLSRIREFFDAEWSSPTDDPKDVTDDA